jgi:DNA replication and repair protein RecF
VLESRGTAAPDLDAFEQLMGVHGAATMRARAEAARRLLGPLGDAFARITRERLRLEARYEPGGPDEPEALAAALAARRDRDRARGSAGVGPQRDELALELEGHGARAGASQGEHRAITLALKLAELACIADARGVFPVLLLDDVSSELDPERTAALFEVLHETPAQIFLTTTRPELIRTPGIEPGERRDFAVDAGAIRPVEPPA